MSEYVEIVRSQHEVERERRRQSWEQRGVAIAALEGLGYTVKAKGEGEMHFRIKLGAERGYVDFWPSTWKWHHKFKGEMRPRLCGTGLKAMIEHMQSILPEGSPQG